MEPNLRSVNEEVVGWGVVKLIVLKGLYILKPIIFVISRKHI
jgi:hypothetical protein